MQVFEKIINRLELYIKDLSATRSTNENFNGAGAFYRAKEIVKEVAEEHNNGWVPVSERLPDENIEVDVTVEEIDGGRYVQTSWLQDGQWVIKKSPLKPEVIAWKERPEPYQPKGE